YNNRFRDHKGAQSRSQRSGGRRDPAGRREHSGRRETATVVHPWMSMPDRLAAAQAAMRELAGQSAFKCPMSDHFNPPAAQTQNQSKPASTAASAENKPRNVNVIIRKRRLPANAIPPLANAS